MKKSAVKSPILMFASLLSISVLSVAFAMEPRGQGGQQNQQGNPNPRNPQTNQQNANNNPNPILRESDENVDNSASPTRRINRQYPCKSFYLCY